MSGAEERAREGRVCNIFGMKENCIVSFFWVGPLTKTNAPPKVWRRSCLALSVKGGRTPLIVVVRRSERGVNLFKYDVRAYLLFVHRLILRFLSYLYYTRTSGVNKKREVEVRE